MDEQEEERFCAECGKRLPDSVGKNAVTCDEGNCRDDHSKSNIRSVNERKKKNKLMEILRFLEKEFNRGINIDRVSEDRFFIVRLGRFRRRFIYAEIFGFKTDRSHHLIRGEVGLRASGIGDLPLIETTDIVGAITYFSHVWYVPSLPSGTYTIYVTAYESNGVTDIRRSTFTVS